MAMETQTTHHLLEVLQTEILARLPLKTIFRFKSVCKTWKSTIETVYFRRLFLSLHKNSSSSWSLLDGPYELIGFHGCKTWDLPNSPASLIPPPFKRYHTHDFDYVVSSGGLVLIRDGSDNAYCYVGNPVSQEWVKIPPPPSDPTGDGSCAVCLVTRLDEDGVVLSFIVVRLDTVLVLSTENHFGAFMYSSETGIWTSKVARCPYYISNMFDINLNGTIYYTSLTLPGVVVAHDFYSESEQFRAVQLPDYPDYNKDYKRTLSISGGFVMYVRTLARYKETVLKIWRLNNDDDTWHLLWEVGFLVSGNYVPMAMHPFDIGTVYIWSQRYHHLVSCNLRKGDFTVLGDASNNGHQDCFIDHSLCKKRVDKIWLPKLSSNLYFNFNVCISFCSFVVPRWMEPVPRPPKAEMIDTTSLLSYATANLYKHMRQ
ncbi:unnamed protein product [Eruca vesicaria subsp. sativa]|uniref:F-box domain-containing protein n=1 Tax=Eruca vesicaria subsp. sativa TaxID=29727 RepID=A0ABC8IPR4_ERUVS|nr:unnamed protein product [Eruca vesicaria subsp. sativa]